MSDQIQRETWIPAPTDEVWRFVTSGSWLAEEVILDLRPGGDASFCACEEVKFGWVEDSHEPAEPGDRGHLAFWWAAPGEPASRVELTIDPAREGGSTLTVVETRPLDVLDLIGTPLSGPGGVTYGPALVAA